MMDDFANVGLVAFAHGVNGNFQHAAGEDFFRIECLRNFSHLVSSDKL